MANKQLFASSRGRLPLGRRHRQRGRGLAYALSPKAALAQLVMTGSLGNAFYADAQTQLATRCSTGAPGGPALCGEDRGLRPSARVHEGHPGGPGGPAHA